VVDDGSAKWRAAEDLWDVQGADDAKFAWVSEFQPFDLSTLNQLMNNDPKVQDALSSLASCSTMIWC
jgi:hypothetical protein